MKVIDLLNKIAKGEELPKIIKIYNREWYWNNFDGYVTKQSLSTTPDAQTYLFNEYRLEFALNKEIEIIEEKPKKIEELEDIEECFAGVGIEYNENAPQYKINQLIRNQKNIAKAVNYLLEKESDK